VKDSPPLASPDDTCTPFSQVQTPYGAALCEIHESQGCSKPLPGELMRGLGDASTGLSEGVPGGFLWQGCAGV